LELTQEGRVLWALAREVVASFLDVDVAWMVSIDE